MNETQGSISVEEISKNIVDFGFLAVFAGIILIMIITLGFYAIRVWAKKQDAMLKSEEEKRNEDRDQRARDYIRLSKIEDDTRKRLERVEAGIVPALDRLAEDQERSALEKKFWGEMTESLASQLFGISSILRELATKTDVSNHSELIKEVKIALEEHNVKQEEMFKILQVIENAISKGL